MGDERHVQVIVVVGDERLGLDRRPYAVAGLELGEAGRTRGAPPAGVVQLAVDVDRPGGAPDLQRRHAVGPELRGRIGRGLGGGGGGTQQDEGDDRQRSGHDVRSETGEPRDGAPLRAGPRPGFTGAARPAGKRGGGLPERGPCGIVGAEGE